MAITLSDSEVSDNESGSDEDGNFFAFTDTAVVDKSVWLKRTLLMGNSLSVLTCKKLIISYVRLMQRML